MYTLEKVLYLVNAGLDIYCVIYTGAIYVTDGWLSEMDLDSDTKIEMYRMAYDKGGDEYLILHLA